MCKGSYCPLKSQQSKGNNQQVFTILECFLRFYKLHPLCCSHFHDFLEGCTKCFVIAEATLAGQLLGAYRLMGCNSLMVETDEVLDAQTVDVLIVSDALHGKVLAEVGAVDANQCGELGNGNVVL